MLSVDQMKKTLTRIAQKYIFFTKNLLFVYLFLFHVETIRFVKSFEKNS